MWMDVDLLEISISRTKLKKLDVNAWFRKSLILKAFFKNHFYALIP